MFACCLYYSRLPLLLISIHTTCISLSLRRTSAPIHLTSVLGVLGTQQTFYILIAGLLERNIFDLYFPEFDKPWVIHLRETCYCSTDLCTWRPNTVYKSRSIRRHQPSVAAGPGGGRAATANPRSLCTDKGNGHKGAGVATVNRTISWLTDIGNGPKGGRTATTIHRSSRWYDEGGGPRAACAAT